MIFYMSTKFIEVDLNFKFHLEIMCKCYIDFWKIFRSADFPQVHIFSTFFYFFLCNREVFQNHYIRCHPSLRLSHTGTNTHVKSQTETMQKIYFRRIQYTKFYVNFVKFKEKEEKHSFRFKFQKFMYFSIIIFPNHSFRLTVFFSLFFPVLHTKYIQHA